MDMMQYAYIVRGERRRGRGEKHEDIIGVLIGRVAMQGGRPRLTGKKKEKVEKEEKAELAVALTVSLIAHSLTPSPSDSTTISSLAFLGSLVLPSR